MVSIEVFNWIFTALQPKRDIQTFIINLNAGEARLILRLGTRHFSPTGENAGRLRKSVPTYAPDKEWNLKLSLQTQAINKVTVLRCQGRFTYRDEATAFSQKIAELLPHTRQLVVELSALDIIDSAALGELVVVHMWTRASGCALKLAAPNARIQHVLELTNLSRVFDIHPTLDEALLAFGRDREKGRSAGNAA